MIKQRQSRTSIIKYAKNHQMMVFSQKCIYWPPQTDAAKEHSRAYLQKQKRLSEGGPSQKRIRKLSFE